MDMELEMRPRQPLMLKEWLELESSAELSGDGFGCYPRHLAAELRNASGRRRNGDVIARVSAAVRAALLPSGRAGEAGALLPRSLSRRLRAGFWKKRKGEREVMEGQTTPSCSATVIACGRRDGSSSPAMSPRRASWEGRRPRVDGAGLGSRRSHEAEKVEGSECETARRIDEEREQEQRLSPVSVMDFPEQDEDDGHNETGGHGKGEDDGIDDDDETLSPTFTRSMANIQRASQLLLQKIRQFEQLAELDPSDADAATTSTATEDASCRVAESDTEDDDEAVAVQDLLCVLQVSSPVAACRFRKLLEDFFRDGLASSSCHREGSGDPETARSTLLSTAQSWLDGRHCTTLKSDWKADGEEMERRGWWRRFGGEEREMLAVDVEADIFWSLMDELVDDLC